MIKAIRPGVQFMLLSTLWFALMNVSVKQIQHLPATQIILFRAVITLIFTGSQLMHLQIAPWGNNKKVLILRGVFGTMALTAYFVTLKNLPLATAISLQYISPIFTVILSSWLLREKLAKWQWPFFMVSFGGVWVLHWTSEAMSPAYLALGIGSAFFSALAYTMIRKAAPTEHPSVVVFYFPLVAFPMILPWAWIDWVWPLGVDWIWLILAGVFTQFAQMAMTKAFMAEKAAAISSLQYLGLVYGLGFGVLFFGEKYNWSNVAGMLLIVGGVVANLFVYERAQRKKTR